MDPPEKKKNDQLEPSQAIPSKVVVEPCPMKQSVNGVNFTVKQVSVQDDQDHKTIAQPKQVNDVTGTVEKKVPTGQFEPVRKVESWMVALKLGLEHQQQQQPKQEINPKQYIHGAPQVPCKAKCSNTSESRIDLHRKSNPLNLSPEPNFWPSNEPYPSKCPPPPPPPPKTAPIRPDDYVHLYNTTKPNVPHQNIKSTTSTKSHSRESSRGCGCGRGEWQRRQRELERRRRLLDKVTKDAQKTQPKVAPPSSTDPTDTGYVLLVPLDYKLPQEDTMKGPVMMRVFSDTAMFAPDGFVHLYNSHTKTIDLIKIQVKSDDKSQAKVASRAKVSRSPPDTPSPLGPDDHVFPFKPPTRPKQTVLSKGPKSVYRVPADTPKALSEPDQNKQTQTVKTAPTMMKVQQEEDDIPTAVILPDDYVNVFNNLKQIHQANTAVKGNMSKSNEKKTN